MKKIVAMSPIFTEDSINLKRASLNSNYDLNRFDLKWNVPEEFRNDVIAVYGEDIYADIVSQQCNLKLSKPDDNWLVTVDKKFTKRKIQYGLLKEFADQTDIFIKCSDFKNFVAGVYKTVKDIKGFDSLDLDSTVFVSEIVDWKLEVRCFVSDGKIQTFSTYFRNKEFNQSGLSAEEEIGLQNFFSDFMEKNESTLPNAVVLDFGIIKNQGWAIIEANPAWCSGLYACNPEKALEVIIKSCIKLKI